MSENVIVDHETGYKGPFESEYERKCTNYEQEKEKGEKMEQTKRSGLLSDVKAPRRTPFTG